MVEAEARPARGKWRNALLTLACIAAVVFLIYLGKACFYHPAPTSYSAPAARLTFEGVTYLANYGIYVLAQPDSRFIAVDQQDRNRDNRLNGCVVRWRADLQGGSFMADDRCGGATFDRTGASASGGLSLLRHPVRLAGKSVVVDIRQCIAPEIGAARPCTDFRH